MYMLCTYFIYEILIFYKSLKEFRNTPIDCNNNNIQSCKIWYLMLFLVQGVPDFSHQNLSTYFMGKIQEKNIM